MTEHQNTDLFFAGVMDLDSADEYVQPGNYRHAYGIINGKGSEGGTVRLLKGNYQFPMTLPAGTNSVVGAYEDKRRQSIIFFVRNSLSPPQDTIWRWFPNEHDDNNPNALGRIEKLVHTTLFDLERVWAINHCELIDDKYLIWTDARSHKTMIEGNPPRKLDIQKASIFQKRKTYELYGGLHGEGQFPNGMEFFLTITEDDGTVIWPTTKFHELYGYYNDPEGALEELAETINSYCDANELPLGAEYCGCKIALTTELPEIVINITTSIPGNHFVLVPLNFYPTLVEPMFDLARRQPRFEPSVFYGVDPDIEYNYVQKAMFQFRVRYHYDDESKSAWGPISIIPLPLDSAGNHLSGLNYIEVDFTDDILNEQWGLSIIRRVEIAVREGNEGLWKSAEILDSCSIGYGRNFYRFYNDQVYGVVASDESGPSDTQNLKLFDDVPQLAGTLEVVSDKDGNSRLVLGANQRGYDADDCADLTFTVELEEESPCLINVKGRIVIRNTSGGAHEFGALHPEHLVLDGFVVYLAGTDYYGISDNFTGPGATGEFEITGVPPGKYFLRVANYKCRFDDSQGAKHNLNNGREWQQTSSPVFDCMGSTADTGIPYERYLDLTGVPAGDFDTYVDPDYGPIYIENWDFNTADTVGFEFYLLDNQADSSSNALRKASTGMERQKVYVRYNDGLVESPDSVELITDHNGYAWHTYEPVNDPDKFEQFISTFKVYVADACNPGDPELELDPLSANTIVAYIPDGPLGGPPTIDYEDAWLAMEAGTEILATLPSGGAWYPIMYYSSGFTLFLDNTDVSENNKTVITGVMKDQIGVGVENVVVCLERNGRAEETDADGEYSIGVWLPWDSADSFRSDDRLVYAYPADECFVYPPSPSEILLEIGEFCAEVDHDTAFEVADVAFPFAGQMTLQFRYLKSGGRYKTGIVYEDEIGRKTTVVRGPDLYIPFHTEVGDYKKPVVYWEINSQPPDWADRYRIVLTKDMIYRRYFQYVIETVSYVVITNVNDTPAPTTYGAGNATHILLKISAEIDPATDTDPVLFFFRGTNYFAFEPEQGDRVRVILDETGAIVGSGIFDMEIVGRYLEGEDYYAVVKYDNLGFEIKDNFLLEFYTPNQLEEIVYYERGDSYQIIYAGDEPNHEGQTQDQIAGAQPAQGRLMGGDTYWRERNFPVDASTSFSYITENKNFSDEFDSEDEDLGRPNVYAPDYKQRYLFHELCLSDVYIPTSSLNGIPSFRSLEKQVLDRGFGPIRKLTVLGSKMLAICEYKTQPIYIGQGYILGLDGEQTVVRSQQILNIADQTVHDYGTQHPESVVNEAGMVKAFDAAKGIVWQYGANGQVPITQGLQQFFNDMGKQADQHYTDDPAVDGIMWCPAGYDRKRGSYWLSFIIRADREDTELYTVCYDDQKNGWNTFQRVFPDLYSRVGLWFVQLRGGRIWIGEEGATTGTFFGTAEEPSLSFVVNPNPATVKDWHNIELLANDLWVAPLITTPENNIHLGGQTSRLRAAHWSRLNGMWCSDFKRDQTDPAFNTIADATIRATTSLLQGRVLKSNVMTIKLVPVGDSNDADVLGDSWLKVVRVEWTPAFDTK